MPEGVAHQDLKGVWLFSGCSQPELRKIAKVLQEVTVPTGTLLVEEGHPGLLFFIVVDGRATVQRGQRTVAGLGPGDHFGELSLLDRQPRSASVICDTDMTLLLLRQRDFQKVLRTSPSIVRKLLAAMSGRLRLSMALAYQ